MKLYLIKNKSVGFHLHLGDQFFDFDNGHCVAALYKTTPLLLTVEPSSAQEKQSEVYSKILKQLNSCLAMERRTGRGYQNNQFKSSLEITLALGRCADNTTTALELSGPIIKALSKLCLLDHEELRLKLKMSHFVRDVDLASESKSSSSSLIADLRDLISINSKGMKIDGRERVSDRAFPLPESLKRRWIEDGEFDLEARISLQVMWNSKQSAVDSMKMNQKILNDAVASNVTIVSGDDAKFECHHSFLSVNSPVLRVMLENNMEESRTRKIEMADMSGKAVKAFLEFLYCREVDRATVDPSTALELLNAAEKYDVPGLKSTLTEIFLKKDESWWTVKIAFQVFLFARVTLSTDKLKDRAVEIMKLNKDDLIKSDYYHNIFVKDAVAARELSTAFLSQVADCSRLSSPRFGRSSSDEAESQDEDEFM